MLTGVGGLKLVSDVNAGLAPTTTIPMALNTGPTTGSVKLFNTSNYFDNPHAVPATITSISVTNTFFNCSPNFQLSAKTIDVNAPFCSDIAPNNIVQPGAQCKIQCYSVDNIDGSDIRLKQDINFLTKLKNGIKLYSFTYLPSYSAGDTEYVGVMAQYLLKDERYKGAVSRMHNGYYAVNYKTIGLEMKTLEEWKQSAR